MIPSLNVADLRMTVLSLFSLPKTGVVKLCPRLLASPEPAIPRASKITPTVSIPLIPTIAFFWERLGVERDAAMSVLREAIAEAMRAKTDESPAIKSKMDDVAEAVTAVKRDLIEGLPKMRRAGRTDVSDLKVSVNALTPVSEPLYAVA